MAIARRDFLVTVGGAAAAATLGTAARAQVADTATTAPAGADPGEPAFAFADDRVPMNAANFCPMPAAVAAAAADNLASQQRDLSSSNRKRLVALKDRGRERIAGMLGVEAPEIAIVRNTSEGNSTIVQGLALGEGDEVLLWDENHPSNGIAWDVRAQRDGFVTRRFSVPANPNSIDEVVDHIVAEVGPGTRVVSFTHISNITGFRLPVAELCATLRQRGDIFIHVDGAQTWGVVDIDLSGIDCDSFSASSHKWFMGPRESGILYVATERVDSISPLTVSLPWGSDVETSNEGALKFEALGQRDNASLAALETAALFHETLTPARVEQGAAHIADYLREQLVDAGVSFVSPLDPRFRSNVLILRAEREPLLQLVDSILADAGVIVAPVNGLRLSPHIYNTTEHADRVVAAIRKYRHLLPAA